MMSQIQARIVSKSKDGQSAQVVFVLDKKSHTRHVKKSSGGWQGHHQSCDGWEVDKTSKKKICNCNLTEYKVQS